MANEIELTRDGQNYVLRPGDDGLHIGTRVGGDVRWLDEQVPWSTLGSSARDAVVAGRGDDPALRVALDSVLSAVSDRGA
jgi:hypothetical protein